MLSHQLTGLNPWQQKNKHILKISGLVDEIVDDINLQASGKVSLINEQENL